MKSKLVHGGVIKMRGTFVTEVASKGRYFLVVGDHKEYLGCSHAEAMQKILERQKSKNTCDADSTE